MGKLVYTTAGEPAQRACWALIRELQATDPLALVTVVVPNAACGLQLRRAFTDDSTSAMINVRTAPISALAQALGADTVAADGAAPLTPALHLAFVRAALAENPKTLYGLGHHPATALAVAETLTELAGVAGPQLDGLAARGRLARDLVTIERARRARASGFYDHTQVYRAAARAIREQTARIARVGQVILYQPTALSSLQLGMCAALAETGNLNVVVHQELHDSANARDDNPITNMHIAFEAWFAAQPPSPAKGHPPEFGIIETIVEAPEPHDELRWIAHDIRQRCASGLALSQVAVAMRVEAPYRRIAIQTLTAAGIQCTGESPRNLAATVGGRACLTLLDLARGEWHRDSLIAWLQSAPIVNPADRSRTPVTQWDAMSRRAGVISGYEQWVERLAQWENAHGQYRATARSLSGFVEQLAADIAAPTSQSWSAWSQWLTRLCTTYLGNIQQLNEWPEADVTAYERVLSAIESLAALSAAQPSANLDEVTATMTDLLGATAERLGSFGHGVFIATTPELRGCTFDVVYIVGMSEGMYPPRGSENPLLGDRLREEFLPDSPVQRTRASREREIHHHAAATAQHLIYTYPRGDVREQRSFLPSQYVIEAAARRIGAPLDSDSMSQLNTPWFVRVESFTSALSQGSALTNTEAITAALVNDGVASAASHPLVARDSRLTAGFEALSSRDAESFGVYDGSIGEIAGLLPDRPLAPTALEEWARCPFKYFLLQVLQLREVERPETLDGISAKELGNLVHDILDNFLRTAPQPASPTDHWSDEARAKLLTIAQERFADAQSRGVTGRPLLWAIAQRRIFQMLRDFLRYDEIHREQRGVVPFHSELAFGIAPDPAQPNTVHAPPVTLNLGPERTVQFRGRIDRIDRAVDGGQLVITDYKTGHPSRDADPNDPVAAGRQLQLAVYALAAAPLAPNAEVAAFYWYLAEAAQPVGHSSVEMPAVHQRLHEVASLMLHGIAGGNFPAVPGKPKWLFYSGADSWEHCEHCQFDRICPLDRHRDFERKGSDEALANYRDLMLGEHDPESFDGQDPAS